MNEYICCICGKHKTGYGNNPWPVVNEFEGDRINKCCDNCNKFVVIPQRIGLVTANGGTNK